jgi:hypothetical protein
MSAEFETKVAIPTELIKEFIDLLNSKDGFDKWKAINLGLKVAQWLVETFGDSQVTLQNKDALQGVLDGGHSAKAIPLWLLPVIVKLITIWLTKK